MKILLCHNFYQQAGGEDQVFADEGQLLESHGHHVVRYVADNATIDAMPKVSLALRTIWNKKAADEIGQLARRERVDIVHFHNTFPLISPAAYGAARQAGARVIQTLHNFRLLCPGAAFYRNGKVCENCLGKSVAVSSVVHGCYRGSRPTTAVAATMLAVHRAAGTWKRAVDVYIAQTEFARQKFISGGLPAERIAVKPNFVDPDPEPGHGEGRFAIFVGRLAQEKGIETLLDAWSRLEGEVPLKIAGDGPLSEKVREAASRNDSIEWLGRRPVEELLPLVGKASCMIVPSVWYESCPKTILEAFAKGTPVIASRLGSMAELVEDGRTGLNFEPDSGTDLAETVREFFRDPGRMANLRQAARDEYETKFTANRNYELLMEIYRGTVRQERPLENQPTPEHIGIA